MPFYNNNKSIFTGSGLSKGTFWTAPQKNLFPGGVFFAAGRGGAKHWGGFFMLPPGHSPDFANDPVLSRALLAWLQQLRL